MKLKLSLFFKSPFFIILVVFGILFLGWEKFEPIGLVFILGVGFLIAGIKADQSGGFKYFGEWLSFEPVARRREPNLQWVVRNLKLQRLSGFEYSGEHGDYQIKLDGSQLRVLPKKQSSLDYHIESSDIPSVGQPILTGDRNFDMYFHLFSAHKEVIGLLNKELRNLIMGINQYDNQIVIDPGCLQLEGYLDTEAARTLIEIDLILKREGTLKTLLLENFQTESDRHVRLECLSTLSKVFGTDSDITLLFHKCLKDKDIPVQILAARKLGFEGVPHLFSIFKKHSAHRQEIMTILMRFGPNVLEQLLKDPEMAAHAIPRLAESGKEEWVEPFIQLFNETNSSLLQKRIIQGLGVIGSERANSFLVSQVKLSNAFFLEDVISCLETFGGKESVVSLMDLAEEDPAIYGERCQHAILAIQTRLGPVEKGWLSIDTPSSMQGGVSVPSNSSEGNLSLVTPSHDELKP